MGFYTLILLAGLQSIPPELYEASSIDGANGWQDFRFVTMPLLMPTMFVVLVLSLIRAVQMFDQIFVLTGGGPGTRTQLLVQYIYTTGFSNQIQLFGLSAAASMVLGVSLLILTLLQLRLGINRAWLEATVMQADRISAGQFLSLRSGGKRVNTADALTYLYLTIGTILMFGPVLWLVASSFKTQAGLVKYPPPLLPYQQVQVEVEGYDDPLPLFTVLGEDGSARELAQVRRVGIEAQMVDPADPGADRIKINIRQREPVEEVKLAWENYLDPLVELDNFDFFTYLKNSVLVTSVATAITLIINSMAAFALSKYRFTGRDAIFVLFISTLMIPITVILVPVFLVITSIG